MRYWFLAPISWLYGIGVGIRNNLYDWKILPSEEFEVPVISVGNITAGGTGKTPHTEHIVNLLKREQRVAFLSRGYKRKTHGFLLAKKGDTFRQLGDEPCQVWMHHPDIYVAVDANRARAIHRLCEEPATSDTDVVLLDDAFQHRSVTPGINILLMDYNHLPCDDALLPVGRLREPFSSRERAQIVIVTKCPSNIRPIDIRITYNHLKLRPYQRLFFTTYRYGHLFPLREMEHGTPSFADGNEVSTELQGYAVLLVTGIARPDGIITELERRGASVTALSYPDHHTYTKRDMKAIRAAFEALPEDKRLIVTTEKDAVRLIDKPEIETLADNIRVLPVCVAFLQDQEEHFNEFIISYVRKNSRNSIIHQRTNTHHS